MGSPIEQSVTANPGSFDKFILAAFVYSQEFYDANAHRITRYREILGRYPFMSYESVELFNRIRDVRGMRGGHEGLAPREYVEPMVQGLIRSGKILPIYHQRVLNLINEVWGLANQGVFAVVQGSIFDAWFNCDMMRNFSEKQLNDPNHVLPDMAQEQLQELLSLQATTRDASMSFQESMATGEEESDEDILTPIEELNAALGGGLLPSDSTLVAAPTGGGKTVISCQFAGHFALNNKKVLYITTEQRPRELTPRIFSHNLNVAFSEFRKGHNGSILPKVVQQNKTLMRTALRLQFKLEQNLRWMDWADGDPRSVTHHLDPEVKSVLDGGFMPDVIILDWLGGALDMSGKDDLRLMYLKAAIHFYELAKKLGTHNILCAQLNNQQSRNKRRCDHSMLEECKALANNATNAVYISNLLAPDSHVGQESFLDKQYGNVAKARKGPKGLIEMHRRFAFQKFIGRSEAQMTQRRAQPQGGGSFQQ